MTPNKGPGWSCPACTGRIHPKFLPPLLQTLHKHHNPNHQHTDPATTREQFTCPACGCTSPNPHDIEHRYCGCCHWPTGDPHHAPHQPNPPRTDCRGALLRAITNERK